jgi:hypothetical protein
VAQYAPTGAYGQSSSSIAQLVEVTPANPSGDQWCNNNLVSIPANDNPGLAYPSIIGISDSSYNGKTVSNVTVELEGIQGLTDGITGQFLLVAPGGTKDLVFLEAGWNDTAPTSAVNLTFDDSASATVPYNSGTPTTGSYLPADNNEGVNPDTFATSTSPSVDSGVPQVPGTLNFAPPYGSDTTVYTHTNILTFGEAFSGAPANGKWALYSVGPYAVNLNSGWCITLSLNTGVATTTTLTPSSNPATTGNSVTFTATVTSGGNPVTSGGTVTFLDNGVAPAGTVGGNNVVTLNGSGLATFTTSSLTEGDHSFKASYSGTTSDNSSYSSTLYQRINTATTVTNVSSNTWQYCNPGAVQIQGGTYAGPFTPNPSVITVTNLPGTLNTVGVQLTNFSVTSTYGLMELASLVEGPSGAALDFFSNTTQGNDAGTAHATLGNYTFEDSAGSLVTSSLTNINPGTYKPTAYESYLNSADVFTSSTSGFYPAPTAGNFSYAAPTALGSSSTFADVFTSGSSANGDWKLFFSSGYPNATFGAANGWCVNLTENLPILAQPALAHVGTFTQGEQNAAYTVNITNDGPGSTGDPTGTKPLTVTDTLNSAFTYSSFAGTGWGCSAAGQTVTCTNDSAVADGGSYPTLTIDVDVASAATGSINNSVSVSGAGVTAISSNTDSVTIQPAAVLAVSKSHTGTFTQGSTATWTIQVINNSASSGGATSGATVTVQDTLPSGYTMASYTGSGWTCGGTTTVTCTSTQTVAGAGGTFPLISLTVNVPANSPTSVSNTALAWGGGDVTHTSSGTAASGSDNNVTVVQTPASITVNGGGTQTTQISTAFATPLAVTVTDAAGNPINSSSVTFTAPSSGASGTFSNSSNTITVSTNSSGVATASTFTANGTTGGPYSVSVTDSPATAASFSLTNGQAPAITSANSASFLVNSPISFTVTTTGYPAVTLSVTNVQNAIPGVTIPSSGTGTIAFSGTPTATGTETFTITASDGVGTNATQNFTLTVNQAPSITSANSTSFTVGTAGSFTATANGYPAPTISETGTLPSGVTFNAGVLSGTPAAGTGGSYPITITATNGVGSDATQNFTLTVDQPPVFSTANSTAVTAGTSLSFTVTASGYPSPTTLAVSNVQNAVAGVIIPSSGTGSIALSGTPTASGTETFTITATNGAAQQTTQNFTLTVNPGAATHFSISGPASTVAGAPLSVTVTALDAYGDIATGYLGTIHFTSSDPFAALPANYTFVSADSGVHTFTNQSTLDTAGAQSITATDTGNATLIGSTSISVLAASATHLGIIAPASAYAWSPINITVTAYDQFGNIAASYAGTVGFTSSDTSPSATLPANYTFIAGDIGQHTFSATLVTPGVQTITAADSANSFTATTSGTTITIPNLVVTTAADDAGTAGNCTVQTTPGTGTDASCSLRDALLFAASAGSGSVSFDSTAFASTNTVAANTITLNNGTLNIPAHTSITGATSGSGATLTNLVTVAGGGSASDFSVFTVGSGVAGAAINNLTITNGNTSSNGGGISNGGTLALLASTISGNSSLFGGGIYNTGTLTVMDSSITLNAGKSGGGIDNESTASLTMGDCTISGNSVGFNGGGISTGGTFTAVNTTISGNFAGIGGAGIYNFSGTLGLGNSIVSGNQLGTQATPGNYDDLDDTSGNSSFTTGNNGGNVVGYYNVSSATPPVSSNLARLAIYGGPTQTMIPLPGSAAICAGTATPGGGLTLPSTDQRGFGFVSTYCPSGYVDSGAVQTNYDMTFTTEPPASIDTNVLFTAPHIPAVTLTESGLTATFASTPPSGTVSASSGLPAVTLSGTTSATLSAGVGSFSGLTLSSTSNQTGETLTATLNLNGSLNLTATSNPFNVIAITLSPTTLNSGTVGVAYSQQITASNGTAPYTYAVSLGSLPAGLTLTPSGANAGLLSGTPTAGGTFNFTITATDSLSNSGSQAYTLTIGAPTITVTPATLTSGTYGASYNQSVSASGGTASYTYALAGGSSLPPGLTLNSSTGAITGTPSQASASAYTFTIIATDSSTGTGPYTGSQLVSLTINQANATINITPYTVTYDATAHTATGTATGVGGVNLASDLTLSGTTHTSAGTYASDGWSFTDPNGNYANASGTVSDKINQANATINITPYTVTYDATAHTATGTATGVGSINLAADLTLSGTTHTSAGTYANDGWSFTDPNGNYANASGTVSDKINQANATINITPYTVTYDATAHTATGTATGVGSINLAADLTLSGTTHTSAGTYATDGWSFTDPNGNYANASGTVSDKINQANATINVTPYTVTYDGNAHTATGTATGVGGINLAADLTLSGTTHTSAGTYATDGWSFTDPNGNYANASGTITDTINKALPTITLVSSLNPILLQNPVTYTATVASTAGKPTGTVTFEDGGAAITACTGVPVTTATGLATCAVTYTAVATHSITALYNGDANFLAAGPSNTVSEAAIDINLGAPVSGTGSTSETIFPGGAATYSFAIAPSSGTTFPLPVTFTVSASPALPAGTTLTLAPSAWVLTSSNPWSWTLPAGTPLTSNTILSIQDPQTMAAAPPAGGSGGNLATRLAPFSLAFILLPFVGRLRKTGKRLGRLLTVLLLLGGGLAAMAGLSGCGTTTGFFAQTQQSYSITVTVASGSLSHTSTITLTVE